MMFSAPTLYLLDQVPAFLRAVARLNPLTYQLHFLRSAANGEWVTSEFLVVLSLTLIMVCIGYVSTGRMRTCRTRGDRAERTAPLPPQSSPAPTPMR